MYILYTSVHSCTHFPNVYGKINRYNCDGYGMICNGSAWNMAICPMLPSYGC